MELDHDWFPQEIWRHFQVFYRTVATDFDLRYPESRLRRNLELKMFALGSDFSNLLKEFDDAKSRVIPYLDWPLLFEWNERWQQAEATILIENALREEIPGTRDDALLIAVRERLQEIQLQCQVEKIPEEPGLIEMLRFRWRFAALRDEARYLLNKWEISKRSGEVSKSA